jgi:hypothetical protein
MTGGIIMSPELKRFKSFKDRINIDLSTKTVLSARDGVLEYFGYELGETPSDKLFRVYRSPATIANIALVIDNIPVTIDHVDTDRDVSVAVGVVEKALLVDYRDDATASTIALKNALSLTPEALDAVSDGKRELSLGYQATLQAHDFYDFEQLDIVPHHLAIVDSGRCGSGCSFLDSKKGKAMLHKAFRDADEETVNLEKVVEIAQGLPDAIKVLPMEQLTKVLPVLQQIIAEAKASGMVAKPEEEEEEGEKPLIDEGEEVKKEEDVKDEDVAEQKKEEDKKAFGDALQRHTKTILKAQRFLDSSYDYLGKSTLEVMRDALRTQYKVSFTDSEVPVAFKMLKAKSHYTDFGNSDGKLSLEQRIEEAIKNK